MSRPLCLACLLFVCLTVLTASAATPSTYLFLNSQAGDYIGGGVTQTLTANDGTFSVINGPNTVTVEFNSSTQFWTLEFGSPTSVKFGRGEFGGATRTAFRSPTRPGIDVSGDGRGCNTDAGRFLVSDFALASNGTVARLAIDFEQHCEGAAPALYGSLRYNSAVTAVPRFGIGNTYALKGNTGTSDSSVIVSLSMPSTSAVSVQFATADGTAVQGTDYQITTGVVSFPAGVTSQTISIPILGDRLARGSKSFHVKLNTPSGALIGAGNANVLIRDPNIAQTVLAMSSQPGDFIGQGQEYLITLSDGAFIPSNSGNLVQMDINNGDFWTADFAGPTTAQLIKGDYENAQRYPFQPPGTPGLSIDGAARGCNTLTGNFQVTKAGYNSGGILQSFAANFEQHCEGQTPALFGWLRFHSLLQQFSVSDAVIQNSSAVFTVTLNPSFSTSVSVTFTTADGSAVAGTDYAATTQTLTFSPGMLEQTVIVPLLSPGTGSKRFYGQLSAPSGAAVWVGQGSATF